MAAEQDRRSRMAYSTYKAPAKKDGAGGTFTWGSPLDSATFYDSRGTATPGVTLARPPAAQPMAVRQAIPVIKDQVSFPTLGSVRRPVLSSPQLPTVTSAVPESAPMPAKVLLERIVSTRSAGSVEAPQDITKRAQPVSYQSRPMEQDRHSRMAYTTRKEPAKKDGAGGAFTWGSPLDSATFYDSQVTATPGVTLAPALVVESPVEVTQTLPEIVDPVAFPTLPSVTVDNGIVIDSVTEQIVAEDLVEIELAQGMDESEYMVKKVVIAEYETMPLVQENTFESVIVTDVLEEKGEPELVTVVGYEGNGPQNVIESAIVAEVLQEKADAELVAVEVVVSQSVVKAESPSEVSAEETPSEDTSEGVPAKPSNVTPCMQGCFEVIAEKKAIFFKHY